MTLVAPPPARSKVTPTVPAWMATLAGVVAAGVALAVTELVGAVAGTGPSLVPAVGGRFVDQTAGTLKGPAISLFGASDKAALVTGIVVISLMAGGLLGQAAARRPWIGVVGFAAFGVVGVIVGIDTPLTSPGWIVAGAVLGTASGLAVLFWLLHLAARSPGPAAVSGSGARNGRAEDPRVKLASRRSFLVAAGSASAFAAVATFGSKALRSARTVGRSRADVTLPPPRTTVPLPSAQPFSVPGVSPYITPNQSFYRIDTALIVPQVDAATWKLTIDGMVDRPYTITFDELLAMDMIEQPVTLACVSNEVGGDLVGNAVWRGVPLPGLLAKAGVQPGATQIVGRSVDDFTVGFPTALALDGRVAMVAVGMNGEPLPVAHGFPARLIVAGLYGYVSATKWLRRIELTRLEDFDAYWVPRGWAKQAPIKTESRIDVPRDGAQLHAGPIVVAGVAWAPTRGISAVEVQVDDGPWHSAELGAVASRNTWVQWRYVWTATSGQHVIAVRATDGTGAVQTAEEAPPDPGGATGYHTRTVGVA